VLSHDFHCKIREDAGIGQTKGRSNPTTNVEKKKRVHKCDRDWFARKLITKMKIKERNGDARAIIEKGAHRITMRTIYKKKVQSQFARNIFITQQHAYSRTTRTGTELRKNSKN